MLHAFATLCMLETATVLQKARSWTEVYCGPIQCVLPQVGMTESQIDFITSFSATLNTKQFSAPGVVAHVALPHGYLICIHRVYCLPRYLLAYLRPQQSICGGPVI